jgi:hypothetical protein
MAKPHLKIINDYKREMKERVAVYPHRRVDRRTVLCDEIQDSKSIDVVELMNLSIYASRGFGSNSRYLLVNCVASCELALTRECCRIRSWNISVPQNGTGLVLYQYNLGNKCYS